MFTLAAIFVSSYHVMFGYIFVSVSDTEPPELLRYGTVTVHKLP